MSAGIDLERLFSFQSAIEAEADKDERVLAAVAQVTADASTESLRVVVSLTTAEGPFVLTLAIDKLTVALLAVE